MDTKTFDQYLSDFKNERYFAAIKVGGECITGALTLALTNLYNLGLYPIVLHGGGKQIDLALARENISTTKIDGKRVTDEKTIKVVREVFYKINGQIVEDLNSGQVRAKGLNDFFAVDECEEKLGYVAKSFRIRRNQLEECLNQHHIPIISSLGSDEKLQTYNINADSAFRYLVRTIRPKKVIVLTSTGGVLKDEKIISKLNLQELETLLLTGDVSGGMKLKLEEIKILIQEGFDVQLTTPESLIEELFSEKGNGTYISKNNLQE